MKTSFLEILLKPDNLPILAMIPAVLGLLAYWWFVARRNDRLLESGGLEAVQGDMQGPLPEPDAVAAGAVQKSRVHTWPYLVRIELVVALIVMVVLTVWSILVDAPLEQLADPNRTPNPSKAPWYFVGLQELLVYFDAWIAGVVFPLLIIGGLSAIPYIDINKKGNGYYGFRERRFEIVTFLFGFLVLWVGLIIIGIFFRGPGWNWFWPWDGWDTKVQVDSTTVNWPELFGIQSPVVASIFGGATVFGYYGLAWVYWFIKRGTRRFTDLGKARYAITAFLFMTMLALPIKMALRLAFSVKYVWVTQWFNI